KDVKNGSRSMIGNRRQSCATPRTEPCQGWGRGFESLRPLQILSSNAKRQLELTQIVLHRRFDVVGVDTRQVARQSADERLLLDISLLGPGIGDVGQGAAIAQ